MSGRYHLELSPEEQDHLQRWLKNPPKPYLRERARAILLVAAGEEGQRVAQQLRIRVQRTTLGEWVKRFQAEGVNGLKIKPGRGRKPCFFPSAPGASAGHTGDPVASSAV
jgi:transposase